MTLTDAADICRPLDERTFPGPQDRTLDLADEQIGQARQSEAREIAQAGVSPEYRAASKALETLSINLHAYCRGMVGRQVVPSYIKQAREALDAMEGAL
jgi:hypothetical protein